MPSCTYPNYLSDATFAGLYCSCNGALSSAFNISSVDNICPATTECFGICANADVSGIGVRVAFYAQSVMNSLLVFFSPRDSIPSAWAGTCLTIALVIPAMMQKFSGNLTLHHATLVFNFATLSCLSSLAVAPKLPIWRLSPEEYTRRELQHRQVLDGIDVTISARPSRAASPEAASPPSSTRRTHFAMPDIAVGDRGRPARRGTSPEELLPIGEIAMAMTFGTRKKIKERQTRERTLLSVALLLQVSLQWVWGFTLFLSPQYSQSECSGGTSLVLFFRTFLTSDIQTQSDDQGGPTYYLLAYYPLWLLFSLGITMFWTIMLAYSGPSQAHEYIFSGPTSRSSSMSRSHRSSLAMPLSIHRPSGRIRVTSQTREALQTFLKWLKSQDRPKTLIIFNYVAAFTLWLLFIIASERQIYINCIFTGENAVTSFGQMAALLLALTPLWSLCVALYKYPALLKRKKRSRRHQQDEAMELRDRSAAPDQSPDGLHPPLGQHGRSLSNSSVVSDTAPLIGEDVIRHENVRFRGPWERDYDSESD